jgi:hypothetical protein
MRTLFRRDWRKWLIEQLQIAIYSTLIFLCLIGFALFSSRAFNYPLDNALTAVMFAGIFYAVTLFRTKQ